MNNAPPVHALKISFPGEKNKNEIFQASILEENGVSHFILFQKERPVNVFSLNEDC